METLLKALILLYGSLVAYAAQPATYVVIPPETASVAQIWQSAPSLERACSCESWGDPDKVPREFDRDGNLLTGYPHAADIGACQINTEVWQGKADELGYDLKTLAGNVGFAYWLYERQGMKPWSASESCWQTKTALTHK